MRVQETDIPGLLVFRPTPHRDERGFFSRTYDDAVAAEWGIVRSEFVQDSQSRSMYGVLRGLHGRSGDGEGKIIRCAHGSAMFVVVDARSESSTLGRHVAVTLDDVDMTSIYVPRRMLTGFQVLGDVADICYSIDRVHDGSEAVQVRYDDPDLGIRWPLAVEALSDRDRNASSWAEHVGTLTADPAAGPHAEVLSDPVPGEDMRVHSPDRRGVEGLRGSVLAGDRHDDVGTELTQ